MSTPQFSLQVTDVSAGCKPSDCAPADAAVSAVSTDASQACEAPADESKGLIVYVNDTAESTQALSTFDRLDNPPDCCRMRTRQLTDSDAGLPEVVAKVAAHMGSWPLPLTVVDGHPVVSHRLPTFDELVRLTNGKTYGPAPSLLPE
ncbi:hypothetical protein [Allorhizocola rhizosphaerae]|uniref:hypothetical protein n=1 Tax=Allorhizocola rhizosphaerae TaxID=1872709 RepID=UPI000E3DA06B|nr:hypothetical protein [Allorhizocola rhizosphaerae]